MPSGCDSLNVLNKAYVSVAAAGSDVEQWRNRAPEKSQAVGNDFLFTI